MKSQCPGVQPWGEVVFTLGNGDGTPDWDARKGTSKAEAPGRRAGGRLYLHRSGPNGLFLALGRRGRDYLQEESSMA